MKPDSYYVVSNSYAGSGWGLNVLFTGLSQTKPKHKIGPKVVDYYLLHHVEDGKGTFSAGGKTYELGPGDSFLIEPGKLFGYEADEEDPWFYRWLAFGGEKAKSALRQVGITSQHPTVHTGTDRAIAGLFEDIMASLQDRGAGSDLKPSGYLHLLLGQYAEALQPSQGQSEEASSVGERIVQQAIQYMTSQYAEPITMELMAESLGYNRAYLSTVFKKHTGLTPVTFLLNQRIERARLLLRERQELTIEQIASSVGFHDPLYFSKQFKRYYKQSPTEYRAEFRKMQPATDE